MSDTSLLLALGNPGPKYALTRHNVGVMVLDELLARASATLTVHKRTNTEIAEISPGVLGPKRVVLARTREFMNLSGGPAKALAGYFGIPPARIVALYDDMELAFGELKLVTGGGDKGHKGLKSLTKSFGTNNYQRLRIGIGRPPGRQAPADFVLRPFGRAERDSLPIIAADAADLVEKHL
ncbi:aminoacyl-tRNA hydrolase [Corynebacterium yudongzhengii]|uniref:Peptidyl-tRNA hydrolase n=1 Tax=Corynebacterium yudongzhengii TaxID=2080740 RepID=A0A2U1T6S8_9CORY|nr:aminoacyl-tRNA hydrolase [Corynebacterium yudongzhengii]AWB82258.1 aminoacyl-tRNA hydrolase [Corynebacterium yudongzhengii]PWC01707.1 aminoacyl-tRNA hydrolase [Corynebacterium yudongzhengii]